MTSRLARFDPQIIIISRDRLTPLVQLLAWLDRAGHERITIVDIDSASESLLRYYEGAGRNVIRLRENNGPRSAIWESGVLESLGVQEEYVVTDCDVVPSEECPLDLVDMLRWCLARYPAYVKAGPALRIDDLPSGSKLTSQVRDWEGRFWERPLERGVFHAPIDTTFAMYRSTRRFNLSPAIRTGHPYTAMHLPWYLDPTCPDEEEVFYRGRSRQDITHWNSGDPKISPRRSDGDRKSSLVKSVRWQAHRLLKVERRRQVEDRQWRSRLGRSPIAVPSEVSAST
jgi:hypothetical protein